MSADLFAEFNQLSSGPPPAQEQQKQQQQQPQKSFPAFQGTSQAQDSFDFFQSSNPPTYQQAQQPQQPSAGPNTWSTSFAPVAQQPQRLSSELDTWNTSFAPAVQQPQRPSSGLDNWGTSFAPAVQQPQRPSSGLDTWNTSFTSLAQQPQQPSSGLGTWNSSFTPAAQSYKPQETAEDDDGWGDFEVAEPEVKPAPVSWETPSPSVQATRPPPPPKPINTNRIRASTMDIMTNNLVDLGGSQYQAATATPTSATTRERVVAKQKFAPSDPSVLFDADDFELQVVEQDEDEDEDEEDDFGDFETVTTTKPSEKPRQPQAPAAAPSMPSVDLLSLNDPPVVAPAHSQRRSSASTKAASKSMGSSTNNRTQAARGKPSVPRQKVGTKSATSSKGGEIAKATINEEEEWAAWDEFEPSGATNNKPEPKATISQPPTDNWDWGTGDTSPGAAEANTGMASMISGISQSDNDPPPTNVPPPSVILSAFPSLLTSGNSLFKPLAGQNISIKQRILSDPKAIEFLKGYILLATTAGHVIAGRKHRWHRDKILAKSMSISAAGSKGMKLAGVDKTQAMREDREAADIAAAWRDLVGRVRSAVAAANGEGLASLKVPELSDTLPVQTAKFVPTGTSPCIICGLKREERVNKVDHDVEDSFGEWWVDHWGHRACKNFWVEHEKMLRQR